jgi:1-acyl-sn-glycerol-3-phosphate acyltransferase
MWSLFGAALLLYDWYWRVEAFGLENVPAKGPAVLAANHSGTLPVDGALLKLAILKQHGRNPWLLAGDLVFRLPSVGRFVRRMGNARAARGETRALLQRGELLGVFPEGFKGIGKGWRQRYRLQPFGRGGFVRLAIEAGAPLIPVAIVGAEEIYPMIGNVKPLARLLRLPYFPVTPTFPLLGAVGALPLPSKCIVAFGEPIPTVQYDRAAATDDRAVVALADEVRATVQKMLRSYLVKRRTVFW